MPITFTPLPVAALMFVLSAAGAQAAELGEATVRSHVGQPLVADVELVDLAPQDLADLQARLASRDVFQGANVSMHPALAGLNVSIVKRDARRTLHLTTSAPVQSELLHLYFELSSGGRQSVRGVTLWLTPAPPAPPAPVPVVQPTRIVAAPPAPVPVPVPLAAVPAPEPKLSAPRPAGVSIQLAAAGVPGKQATRADAELLGAVERAFAARAGKFPSPVKTPIEEKHAAEPAGQGSEKLDKPARKPATAGTRADQPAEAKGEKVAPKPVEKAADKAPEKPQLAQAKPVVPVEAKPAPAKPTQPAAEPKPAPAKAPQAAAEDKAMLKKLAELEAKLKTLQKMVGTAKPAATAPAAAVAQAAEAPAAAPVQARTAPAAPAAAPVQPKAAEVAPPAPEAAPVVEPLGRTASGKITDARAAAPEAKAGSAAQPAPAQADKPAAAKPEAPAAKAKAAEPASAPAEEPATEKKMSRPKMLTMIAGGSLALLLVLGVIIHFVRRRNAKNAKAQIKVWQSWRKKAIAEAAAAEEEGAGEEAAEVKAA